MRNRDGGNLSLPRAAEHGVHSNSNSDPELQLWPSFYLQCRVDVMHVASRETSFRSLLDMSSPCKGHLHAIGCSTSSQDQA